MIESEILNPYLLSLLARVRHTNSLLIADRGFPFWPMIETVDISLVTDIPSVLQVFQAIRRSFHIGQIFMADEFKVYNPEVTQSAFGSAMAGIPVGFEPHETVFKRRVHSAIGIIRTADSVPYSNLILVSS